MKKEEAENIMINFALKFPYCFKTKIIPEKLMLLYRHEEEKGLRAVEKLFEYSKKDAVYMGKIKDIMEKYKE